MGDNERKILQYTRRDAPLTPRQERERMGGWTGFAVGVFVLGSAMWFDHTVERPVSLALAIVICVLSTAGLLFSYFGPRR